MCLPPALTNKNRSLARSASAGLLGYVVVEHKSDHGVFPGAARRQHSAQALQLSFPKLRQIRLNAHLVWYKRQNELELWNNVDVDVLHSVAGC